MVQTQTVIDKFRLTPEERELDVPANAFYTGSQYQMGQIDMHAGDIPTPEGFHYMEAWSDGYRSVFVNYLERSILTFCEGDLDLTVDADEETFQKRLESANKFYMR